MKEGQPCVACTQMSALQAGADEECRNDAPQAGMLGQRIGLASAVCSCHHATTAVGHPPFCANKQPSNQAQPGAGTCVQRSSAQIECWSWWIAANAMPCHPRCSYAGQQPQAPTNPAALAPAAAPPAAARGSAAGFAGRRRHQRPHCRQQQAEQRLLNWPVVAAQRLLRH